MAKNADPNFILDILIEYILIKKACIIETKLQFNKKNI